MPTRVPTHEPTTTVETRTPLPGSGGAGAYGIRDRTPRPGTARPRRARAPHGEGVRAIVSEPCARSAPLSGTTESVTLIHSLMLVI